MSSAHVTVSLAPGSKCERCRKVLPEVGEWPDHPNLCLRCVDAVLHAETGEGIHEHAMREFDAAFRAAVAAGASTPEASALAGQWNRKA